MPKKGKTHKENPKRTRPETGNGNSGTLGIAWTGYAIIIAHLVFVIILTMAMIFIKALSDYFIYVMIGGIVSTFLVIYFVYRKLRKDGRNLLDQLKQNPGIFEHNIRIELLGGVAAVSINGPPSAAGPAALPDTTSGDLSRGLPAPGDESSSLGNELLRLAALYERNLIDREEFELLKKKLLMTTEKTPSTPPSVQSR